MSLVPLAAAQVGTRSFTVSLRSRVEKRGQWEETSITRTFQPRECALVLCDMWDKHWCRGASQRVDAMAKKTALLLSSLRQSGVLIIHAPSDTMEFYRSAPQRLEILRMPKAAAPAAKTIAEPPLPIDDSDGGCDTPGDKPHRAWSRQHPDIPIEAADLVSDNGQEIYSAMQLRGIRNLFVAGVHTNMCILNRSFAIRQMTKWGVPCVLVRDLTDAMYDPQDSPRVSHERGTELVIEHIEKYLAPTVTSKQILQALAAR